MYKLVSRFLLGLSLCFLTLAGTTGCHGGPDAASVVNNSGPDPADANMAPVDNSQPQPAVAPAPSQEQVLAARYQAEPSRAPNSMLPKLPRNRPLHQTRTRPIRTHRPMTNWTPRVKVRPSNTPTSRLRHSPSTSSPWPLRPITSGLPAIGTGPPAGYYWIPGAWCAPPYYGALWTPGYWGFYGGRYGFHRGFWGLHIGFYGGINYGFGYTGVGYHGGYWNGNNFYYNRSVNRVNVNITHVYNRTVVVNNNTRVAYNGGRGGIAVRPQAAEIAAMRDRAFHPCRPSFRTSAKPPRTVSSSMT